MNQSLLPAQQGRRITDDPTWSQLDAQRRPRLQLAGSMNFKTAVVVLLALPLLVCILLHDFWSSW